MLKQRIITALILAPVAIACVFLLPPRFFSVFVALVLAIAAWEWANLADYGGWTRYAYSAALVVLLWLSTRLPDVLVLALGALWWCAALALVIGYPRLRSFWATRPVRALLGVLIFVPAFTGLRQLKMMADSNYLILLLFLLIWGADIGAYFAGRAFGRSKLAPAVSPGKSWAGLYGGLIAALIIAAVMLGLGGIVPLFSGRGLVFLGGCAFVVLVSVLGDLVESMFKRNRGIKDSSNLLPGHGGVLDRIDSLLAAGPMFCLFILMFGWARA